jgi:tyrosinase
LEHSGSGNPFTPNFLGGDGDSAQKGRVTTGPFAYSAGNFEVRVWDKSTGDAGLRREFGDDATAKLPTAIDISAGLAKAPYSPGPNSFEQVSEGALHNPVHRWVGGNMADATSPNDPIFFLHHAYLDLLWERWKQQHPTSAPYTPKSGVPGFDLTSTLVFNNSKNPAPWNGSWTVQQTLSSDALGYTYE